MPQPRCLARLPGAAVVALSGAGSGVITFAESGRSAIQRAMEEAARGKGMTVRSFVLRITNRGADEEDQPVG